MTLLVTLLQWLIVLGAPALFGWMVLRRIVRENDRSILVGGSFVLGLATLMVVMNELRFFLEMKTAAEVTYKLLLLGALAIGAAKPGRRFHVRSVYSWKWMAGIAGATLFVGLFFGIPAFRGYINDSWWAHYPIAVRIQTIEHFPLNGIFSLDEPFYYHYGSDLLAATWSQLLNLSVQHSFAMSLALLPASGFLLAFGLVSRISRNRLAALAAASLLYLGGNLNLLLLLRSGPITPLSVLQAVNTHVIDGPIKLGFTPSHSLAIPLLLLVLSVMRHGLVRPSVTLAAIAGCLLGALALAAEWYFVLLAGGLLVYVVVSLWRRRTGWGRRRLFMIGLALVVGAGWSLLNADFPASLLNAYWIKSDSLYLKASERRIAAEIQARLHPHDPISPGGLAPPAGIDVTRPPADSRPPPLLPMRLRFNSAHLGSVPSWGSERLLTVPYVSLGSATFLLELFPVLGLGLAYGLWLCRSRPHPLVVVLKSMAALAVLPPVLLDWDYISVDLLRFFTAAYCCSALLFGLWIGRLCASPGRTGKIAGFALVFIALANAGALGLIGLSPAAFQVARRTSELGVPLADATTQSGRDPIGLSDSQRRTAAIKLEEETGELLFPFSHGRENVVVVVAENQLPPTERFPEWMEMSTRARIPIPCGWYWNAWGYGGYYRSAVKTLDRGALTALDARWLVVTDAFGALSSDLTALADPARFAYVTTFRENGYYMAVYRVVPR